MTGYLIKTRRELESLGKNQYQLNLDFDIPTDPNLFYQDVGLIPHPSHKNPDGSPQLVRKLTTYQDKVWQDGFRYRYRLTVKSQKVGLSTSAIMEDFQRAILPKTHPASCRGYEILIIGQTYEKAKDHIRTLRDWLFTSEKYRDFLIIRPDDDEKKDESTKTILYIRNPDDPNRPTRIIGLGMKSEASIWSWKQVKFIHMSDVASSDMIDDSGVFAAAFSRVANTHGSVHIETPPHGQRGRVWEIYQQSELGSTQKTTESQFKINKIYATQAVAEGLMTQEDLDGYREMYGIAYSQYFEADFLNSSNQYYTSNLINATDDETVMGV